jgi:hypothetical protein
MKFNADQIKEVEKFYMLMMKVIFPDVDYQLTVLDHPNDFRGEVDNDVKYLKPTYDASDFVVKIMIDAGDREKLNLDNREWDRMREEVLSGSLKSSYDLVKIFSQYKFRSPGSFYGTELIIKDFYKIDESAGKMSFSEALKEVKSGKRIAREGWNGKGMFVYYVGPDEYDSKTDAAKKTFGEKTPYLPYLALKTVDDKVVPWLASQTDILAEDWEVLD